MRAGWKLVDKPICSRAVLGAAGAAAPKALPCVESSACLVWRVSELTGGASVALTSARAVSDSCEFVRMGSHTSSMSMLELREESASGAPSELPNGSSSDMRASSESPSTPTSFTCARSSAMARVVAGVLTGICRRLLVPLELVAPSHTAETFWLRAVHACTSEIVSCTWSMRA